MFVNFIPISEKCTIVPPISNIFASSNVDRFNVCGLNPQNVLSRSLGITTPQNTSQSTYVTQHECQGKKLGDFSASVLGQSDTYKMFNICEGTNNSNEYSIQQGKNMYCDDGKLGKYWIDKNSFTNTTVNGYTICQKPLPCPIK